ncbi:hypothetical protein GA0070624_0558 [Micromonospora rhizosphaerae]|uniref:Ig-like domain-containing protein n=1 Tax=Micromonospora rhizosphaerae TaxID=568872 RepID=A0A1C6RD73_9ACTN|nr:hypothetical protein [Micromonospora rhizosphaerae]SCL14910.1 hypothetical protein GA0070624_0558 [Micromonospora rhizosphaerae]
MTQPPFGASGSPSGPFRQEPPAYPGPIGATPPPGQAPGAIPPPPGYPPHQAGAQPPGYPPHQAPGAQPPGYPPHQAGAQPPGYPPYEAPATPPRKKRGLLIASIVLAAALLLCGGGGTAAFLTVRNAEDGQGAKEPAVAVDGFLTAVYKDRDAKKAATFVCSASRDDKKIAAKVAEVQKYSADYQNPRFRWTTPKVDNQTGDRATVTTKVTMTTSDEKVADQELRFTVVRKTGWWVCEVA